MDEATPQAEAKQHKPRRRVRRFLITGLATLLPTVLTGYIVYLCYRFVHNSLGAWIGALLANVLNETEENAATWAAGDILAVVIVFALAYIVGAVATGFVGRRIVRAGESFLAKVPFVKLIYPYVKQVTDFILSDKSSRFRAVVAVPYPRRGVYSIGFVTGLGMRAINERTKKEMIHVFIPSSPTPITGYVVFVPREDVIELPITVDQAIRFAISGGVIVPPQQLVTEALISHDTAMLARPHEADDSSADEESSQESESS